MVFDKDGTLIDREVFLGTLMKSREASVAARGLEGAVAPLRDLYGVKGDRIDPMGPLSIGHVTEELVLLAGVIYELTHRDWDTCRELARTAFLESDAALDLARATRPTPGVVELVRALHAAGFLLAVATSDLTSRALSTLELMGIEGLFASVVGADMVSERKPAPESLHVVARSLSLRPGELLMVGDSPVDVEMARRAGCPALLYAPEGSPGTSPTLSISSWSQVTVEGTAAP